MTTPKLYQVTRAFKRNRLPLSHSYAVMTFSPEEAINQAKADAGVYAEETPGTWIAEEAPSGLLRM